MPLTKVQLARHIRSHLVSNVIDDSGVDPQGVAIYFLSDPRDLRRVRYVGQTTAPKRRYQQHLNTARLWLPAELPWWVKSPKLRPLYDWIRRLHEDDLRLPVMVVTDWVKSVHMARVAEREHICAHLSCGMPLLNVEQQLLGQQLLLSYGYSQHNFREKEHLRQCSYRREYKQGEHLFPVALLGPRHALDHADSQSAME